MVNLIKEKDHLFSHSLTDRLKLVKITLVFSVLLVYNFIYASVTFADGKTNVLSFDYFSQMDGLPNNQIQCILQDRKGWIWLGTSQGLSRFDGYRFVSFIHNPEDSSSLSGSLVRVIFEDSEGNLLVGTENGGLNIFDREKERFLHPYKNHPEFKSKEVSVNTIAEDPDGNLYIGTDRNLLKVDKDGNLGKISPLTSTQTMGFTGTFVRVIQFDNSGNLWLGTNNGLFLYHPDSNFIEEVSIPLVNEQSREVYEIFKDDDGLLWIGTYSNGLFITDPVTKSVHHLNLDPYYERTETVRAISKGILGDYWIGTRGGLYVYSKTRRVTGFFRHDDRDNRSLANNSVLDILHDASGETWIGTRGGLNLLAKSKQLFRNFSAFRNKNQQLLTNQ